MDLTGAEAGGVGAGAGAGAGAGVGTLTWLTLIGSSGSSKSSL